MSDLSSLPPDGLLSQAFRHRSAGRPNNERLEFLGDAVLGLLVSEALYLRFQAASEGELTRARSRLVRQETLANLAREQGLGERLQLGHGEMKSGGHRRDSILADTAEAVIAAVYLEQGIEAARSLVTAWLGDRLQLKPDAAGAADHKSRLQEWLQARRHALPEYRLLQATGSEHDRRFEASCTLAQLAIVTTGTGSTVKAAEADAARLALAELGLAK